MLETVKAAAEEVGDKMLYFSVDTDKEDAIVETKKLSGMPMEIMVNGSLFGKGEVVVVGDNLAIRITDLEKPDLT